MQLQFAPKYVFLVNLQREIMSDTCHQNNNLNRLVNQKTIPLEPI